MRLWVDQLSRASLARAVEICRREGITRIEYLDVHPDARRQGVMTAAPAGFEVVEIDYDLSALRAPNGRGLTTELSETVSADLPAALDKWLNTGGLRGTLSSLTRDEVVTALQRTAGHLVRPAAGLAILSKAVAAAAGSRILLIDHHAIALAGDWPLFHGERIETYGARGTRTSRGLGALRAAALAAREWVALHLRGIAASSPSGGHACIAVQLLPPDGTDPISYPWFPASGVDPAHVCIYADRPDVRMTPAIKEEIGRRGHSWIAFGNGATLRGLLRPYLTRPFALVRESVRVLRHAFRSDHPLAGWESSALLWLLWRAAFWEAVCRRHRIAAIVNFTDAGTQVVAQAAGVRMAGGISIGWHWSHLPFASSTHARYSSTFFAWGALYRPIFEREGLRVSQFVYTGVLPARPGRGLAPSAVEELRRRGARCVICFFDSAPGTLAEVAYSRRGMLALYKRLLEEVVATGHIGLIIKPKTRLLPAGAAELAAPLAAARATGRLCELPVSVTAQDAAAGADLVVAYAINSAGLEAAVRGQRVIHVDLDGAIDSPFYDRGAGTIVFDTIDGVIDAVHRFDREGHASAIGDHAFLFPAVDFLHDGGGHARMGWYLKTYLDGLRRFNDAGRAHLHAGEEYRRRYGASSVVFRDRRDLEGSGIQPAA